ncbi:AfsR/SARP family transcriptional regulator [Streptosporangium sp. CA-135522]|uniref:AfsR/SARP family transcriptional regulator n=1 Tax=Streptosporangium sp. CA-135522 TaxID=3240072 RepID=UPI003D8F6575
MRIGILGPLRVSGTEIGGARLRFLLVRLALDPGRVITAERLIDDLWPDGSPAHPANALQSLVSRLRRELPGAIVSHPAGYLLDLPREEIDAWAFERLAGEGRAVSDDPIRAASLLREALSLWRGAALADASGMAFAIAPAAHLEELRLTALQARFDADLALAGGRNPGSSSDLVAELEKVTATHPLHEPFHARLVLALLADGRRADALEAFERIRLHLADRLGVDPGPELRDAHLTALRDGPSRTAAAPRETAASAPAPPWTSAPLTSAPAPPRTSAPVPRRGNLPARLTSFVGRQADLARLRELLGNARLVTLTGPGGVGKTRLAIETAAGLDVPDGVWLVELAALSHPSGVAAAVQAVLGGSGLLTDSAGRGEESALDRLAGALRDRSPLLILDNCEHVIDEAARIAGRLLAASGGLRILATSREPLDITGESLHPVLPLGTPGPGAGVEDALAFPAVALFGDRAAAALPGMRVDHETVTDVVRLCRELDGIPLAIELAAARLRSLTPGQLADMIGDRLAFRGSRTAQPRHRTLRAVIDWSWELLSADERTLLRRMSVFSGGATADAIRRVCGQDVDMVASLVDRSLVAVSPRTGEDGDEVRYRLLETVRQYAAERLKESGEADRVRTGHALHFLELAEAAEPSLRTGDQLRLLTMLDIEQGNLDAALDHAISVADGDLALQMIMARLWPWVMRGRRREAGERAAAVLAAVGEDPPKGRELAHALCVLTAPARPSATRDAPTALTRALRTVKESDHPAALGAWVIANGYAGGPEETFERALAMSGRFRDHHDPWTRATARLVGGIVEFEYGRAGASRAQALLRPALEDYRLAGDRWGLSLALYWLSLAAENGGDFDEALSLLEESAASAAEIGGLEAVPGPAMLRVRLGQLRARTGDLSGAEKELDRAWAAVDRRGTAEDRAWAAVDRRGTAEDRAWAAVDRRGTAVNRAETTAQGDGGRNRDGDGDGTVVHRAGTTAHRDGTTAHRGGDVVAAARVGYARGELARLRGDLGGAETLLRETLELLREQAAAPLQLVALVNVELSRVLRLRGEPGLARSPLRRALESIVHSGDETVRASVLEEAAEWHASAAPSSPAMERAASRAMERAAALIGAAHALRGIARTTDPAVGSLVAQAVAALGEDGYRTARERGAALSSPESLALEGISPRSP